ncbi:MAG: DUF4493 domain-containing protein [Odoribacter splanchnicus]|nr:DUF4493 domain-containing protein [Odoribacter splanchnicus]
MKNILFYILLLFLFTACQKEAEKGDRGGSGWLAVDFFTDNSVQSRANEPLYVLEIQKADGTVVSRFEDCNDITDRILLPVGTYRLIATDGEEVVAEFESPFYKCEQEVKIEAAVTKDISMICTQANVKVSVEYSDLIKEKFADYSLEVTNGEGSLLFGKGENRAGFLKEVDGTLVWNLNLDNGQEKFQLTKTITGVEPRQYYRFRFDVKESGDENEGAFVPGIVVDTTTDIFNWLCEIVLKDSIAKPEIKGQGFDLNDRILVLNDARGADAKVDITALAKIQELKLRHNSSEVKALGVPEVVTISNITPELKNAVNTAGITWGNESVLDAQQATVDFSGLLNKLPLGEYEFYLSVYDARKRLVIDTLYASVIPDMDHIAQNAVRYEIWAKCATVSGLWYTKDKPEGLGLEYSTDQISWTSVPAGQIAFNEAGKSFRISMTGLQPATTYYYRTVSNDFTSDDVKTFTTESEIQVPYLNFDTWFKAGENGNGSGKNWYLGESGNKYWDSGNEGANTMSEKNPTAPDYTNKVAIEGNEASAYLETKVVFGVMAAGNIYTGDFIKAIVSLTDPGAQLDFGIPYNGRPTSLTGYYKYQPVNVTQTSRPNVSKGDLDSCHVYVALFADWTSAFRVNTQTGTFVNLNEAIAYGEMKDSRTMSDFEKFEFEIKYRDETRIPTYILIVATASKYGDYFTGGEGSKLWLDEFSLGFEPPKK